MPAITFTKMTGSGNDFIVIDNRETILGGRDLKGFVAKVCSRRLSVGADGLILIEDDEEVDFSWRFFNADGSEVEMCGNGGRCAARFAYLKGIAGKTPKFRTRAGIIEAHVDGDSVKLKTTDPHSLRLSYPLELEGALYTVSSVNTGVPHVVMVFDDFKSLQDAEIFRLGRAIRYHREYAPLGTNANFMTITGIKSLTIRTYERGVEDETLACGTGAIASAIVAASLGLVVSPVKVLTRAKETLTIHFTQKGGDFREVFLEGRVRVVYGGELSEEALDF